MISVTFFVVEYSSKKPSLLRCPPQVHGNGDQRYNWTLYLANLRHVLLTADRYHLRKEQHKEDENPEIRLEFNIAIEMSAWSKLTSRWISWQIMQSERQQCNNPLFIIQNPSKARMFEASNCNTFYKEKVQFLKCPNVLQKNQIANHPSFSRIFSVFFTTFFAAPPSDKATLNWGIPNWPSSVVSATLRPKHQRVESDLRLLFSWKTCDVCHVCCFENLGGSNKKTRGEKRWLGNGLKVCFVFRKMVNLSQIQNIQENDESYCLLNCHDEVERCHKWRLESSQVSMLKKLRTSHAETSNHQKKASAHRITMFCPPSKKKVSCKGPDPWRLWVVLC